jgi:hypothetical protein
VAEPTTEVSTKALQLDPGTLVPHAVAAVAWCVFPLACLNPVVPAADSTIIHSKPGWICFLAVVSLEVDPDMKAAVVSPDTELDMEVAVVGADEVMADVSPSMGSEVVAAVVDAVAGATLGAMTTRTQQWRQVSRGLVTFAMATAVLSGRRLGLDLGMDMDMDTELPTEVF